MSHKNIDLGNLKAPKMSPAQKFFADRGLRLVMHGSIKADDKRIRFHAEKDDGRVMELEPEPLPDESPAAYLKRIGLL